MVSCPTLGLASRCSHNVTKIRWSSAQCSPTSWGTGSSPWSTLSLCQRYCIARSTASRSRWPLYVAVFARAQYFGLSGRLPIFWLCRVFVRSYEPHTQLSAGCYWAPLSLVKARKAPYWCWKPRDQLPTVRPLSRMAVEDESQVLYSTRDRIMDALFHTIAPWKWSLSRPMQVNSLGFVQNYLPTTESYWPLAPPAFARIAVCRCFFPLAVTSVSSA